MRRPRRTHSVESCPEHGMGLKRVLDGGYIRCPYKGVNGGNCMFTRRLGKGGDGR